MAADAPRFHRGVAAGVNTTLTVRCLEAVADEAILE